MECRDILESSLELLKSDFSYIDKASSVLIDDNGHLYPNIEKSLKQELERVICLLNEVIK